MSKTSINTSELRGNITLSVPINDELGVSSKIYKVIGGLELKIHGFIQAHS